MNFIKKYWIIVVIVALSYFTLSTFLKNGFFPMHDDTQVGRIVAMGRALRNGQFPVRWVSDLGYGYGYPIYNFYGPLPYYVGGYLYAFGVNGLAATKISFILALLLSAITMFALGNHIFGRTGGFVASLFYLYAPYHAVDTYVRGALGELWTFVFLPLVLLGLVMTFRRSQRKPGLLLGALGLSGVILSHTILGYVTVIFVGFGLLVTWCYLLLSKKLSISLFLSHILLFLVALGFSAFFWLPAISEMKYTNVASQISASADFHDHYVCLSQLWNSPWGFGGSAPGCIDGMSFRLGKLSILLAVVSVAGWVIRRKKIKKSGPFMILGLCIVAVSVFISLSWSNFLWNYMPYFSYIQYPWRFLTFISLGLSILCAGFVLWIPSRIIRIVSASVFVVGLIYFNAKLFLPQYLYTRPFQDYETSLELRYRVSKISDEYLPKEIIRPTSLNGIPVHLISAPSDTIIDTEQDTETYIKAFINTQKDALITVNRAYFPGWVYFINGKSVSAKVHNGIPNLVIPEGSNVLEVQFADTPVRRFGNILSLGTVVILFFFYASKKTFA